MRKLFWDLLYLRGDTRWDTGITPPEVVEVVEGGQVRPGRALDIGCGTGTNSVYLARHGFEVVGVDVAWLAIRRARRRARRAGVRTTFYRGDVAKLGTAEGPPLGKPFDLALDIGCFHSLGQADGLAYVEMLRRVLRPGGFYMLYAWGPAQIGRRWLGATPDEVRGSLGEEFKALWVRRGEEEGNASYWYLFRRALSADSGPTD